MTRFPAFVAFAKTCAKERDNIFEVHSFRVYDGHSFRTFSSVSGSITRSARLSRTAH